MRKYQNGSYFRQRLTTQQANDLKERNKLMEELNSSRRVSEDDVDYLKSLYDNLRVRGALPRRNIEHIPITYQTIPDATQPQQIVSPQVTTQPVVPITTPKSDYKGISVVDYIKSLNLGADRDNRKKLAESLGIKNYNFSAAKNLELLAKLRGEKFDPKQAQAVINNAPSGTRRAINQHVAKNIGNKPTPKKDEFKPLPIPNARELESGILGVNKVPINSEGRKKYLQEKMGMDVNGTDFWGNKKTFLIPTSNELHKLNRDEFEEYKKYDPQGVAAAQGTDIIEAATAVIPFSVIGKAKSANKAATLADEMLRFANEGKTLSKNKYTIKNLIKNINNLSTKNIVNNLPKLSKSEIDKVIKAGQITNAERKVIEATNMINNVVVPKKSITNSLLNLQNKNISNLVGKMKIKNFEDLVNQPNAGAAIQKQRDIARKAILKQNNKIAKILNNLKSMEAEY